ncbi:MAG: hypothetical protein ACOYOA_06885 [Saprospiraceae bacterium]|jgi:hypothetical protein
MRQRKHDEVSNQTAKEIVGMINEISARLPILLELDHYDRHERQNMGNGGYGFCQDALKASEMHAEATSKNFQAELLEKTMENRENLKSIFVELQSLCTKVDNAVKILGQETMEQANDIYKIMQRYARRDRTYQIIVDKMSQYYRRKKKSKNKTLNNKNDEI